MIDIHSHIIFGVDDGAKTIEQTRALLLESYNQGIRVIIASPHRRKNMFETNKEIIFKNFKIVKEMASKIAPDFYVYLGAEIYYTLDVLKKLETGEYWPIKNTKYILIEFSTYITYNELYRAVSRILSIGFFPIIAHIERYDCLAGEPDKVRELINLGALTQVNAESVLKPKLYGDILKTFKIRAKLFLKEDVVYFIASDVHNTKDRKMYMKDAYKKIKKLYGEKRANDLFVLNQIKMLKGEINRL